MRQAYDGFRAMGVDPLFDADLVSAVCFNHTDPFWGRSGWYSVLQVLQG